MERKLHRELRFQSSLVFRRQREKEKEKNRRKERVCGESFEGNESASERHNVAEVDSHCFGQTKSTRNLERGEKSVELSFPPSLSLSFFLSLKLR